MKLALAIVASACVVIVVGCKDYDLRLEETLEELRYQKRLSDNLGTAPTKGLLQQELIYIRPPKGYTGPTQTFGLTVVEPGKFDIENSFIDQAKQSSLHILARHKKPKAATPKKGAATPKEPPPRGDFMTEVIDLIRVAYGAEVEARQFKPVTKKHKGRENTYKEYKLPLATKEVQIFIYGDKNGPYNVAFIFEHPTDQSSILSSKIGLSLEAFAVSEAARRAFSGSGDIEIGEEPTDSGQPLPL
jgi:hypothetical protein